MENYAGKHTTVEGSLKSLQFLFTSFYNDNFCSNVTTKSFIINNHSTSHFKEQHNITLIYIKRELFFVHHVLSTVEKICK